MPQISNRPEFEYSNEEFSIERFDDATDYVLTIRINSRGFGDIVFCMRKRELQGLVKFLTTSTSENYLPHQTFGYIGYDIKSGPEGYTKELDEALKVMAEDLHDERVKKNREKMRKEIIGPYFNLMLGKAQVMLTRKKFLSFRRFCLGLKNKLASEKE